MKRTTYINKKGKVKKKGMCFIVDAVEQLFAELWCLCLVVDHSGGGQHHDQPCLTARRIRELTAMFWPVGVGEEGECNETIDKVILTLLAEVIF